MAKVLPANIDWISAFLKWVGKFWPNICIEADIPHQPFLHG